MIARIYLDEKLKEAYKSLSSLTEVAYRDIYLLSSQVLSKNPFSNNFLKNFLADKDVAAHSFQKVVCKLAKYYLYSIFHFILYIARYVVHRFNGMRFNIRADQSELIIMGTFFLCDKIIQSDSYNELYFKGLDRFFDAMGKNYAYLPVFYGCNKINTFYRVQKILKRDRVPVLSEYQLLSITNLLRLFIFVLAYPWHVLTFTRKLKSAGQARSIKLAKNEMIETLDQVTFPDYSRYLQGMQIAQLPYKKIKLISWYENQTIDKNLYRGLRTIRSNVSIYGAQLFLYSNIELNIIVDEREFVFNVIPDKIIVNGPFFIPESSRLNYVTGPSLRYRELFTTCLNKERQKDILVLLSYLFEDTKNILRMLSELNLSSRHVIIKPHPTAPVEEFRSLIQPHWTIGNEDTYNLFETAKMVIGSASGSLVEAISIGIPVIKIKNHQGLDYNILPELGKGVLWGEAGNTQELMARVNEFENIPEQNHAKMKEISLMYKEMFFCEPTREKIIEAFDL